MQKRIFKGAVLLATLSVLLVGILAALVGYQSTADQLTAQLEQELTLISSLKENAETDEAFHALLTESTLPNRLTWIAADGVVLFDNQSDPAQMENHLQREEIAQAQSAGTGFSSRYSGTLLEEQVYVARRLSDGGFLRIAATRRTIGGMLSRMAWALMLGAAAVILLAALLSRGWTKRLVRPINEIDLENPLNNQVYDELSPMLRRMAEQNRRLEAQVREISDRRNELDTIISHMNEGLLILDEHRRVLMMNESARAILHTERAVDGKTAIAVYNRSQTLLDQVDTALKEGSAHAEWSVGEREYLLTASVVRHREGLVLLLQDVTERNAAEKARKRFTANVSHELRTPLTAISGYAELLQNGMAQPQDAPLFARKIYNESRRLLQLIEDILHLSKLDEGYAAGRMEPIDMLEAAKRAASELVEIATDRSVTVKTEGDSALISGDPTLVDEMLRNVMENGIKYNRPNGTVQVRVSAEGDHVRVTIADTGIGIPQEHQSKVFERFYRVDSSRSKQTGGTGLGLSIVKHGAEYHHAEVKLKSEVGEGTTVTLLFPSATSEEEAHQPS